MNNPNPQPTPKQCTGRVIGLCNCGYCIEQRTQRQVEQTAEIIKKVIKPTPSTEELNQLPDDWYCGESHTSNPSPFCSNCGIPLQSSDIEKELDGYEVRKQLQALQATLDEVEKLLLHENKGMFETNEDMIENALAKIEEGRKS